MNLNATLLVQMVTFGLFIFFTMKVIWPPFIRILTDRQTKIAQGLEAAQKGEDILATAHKEAGDLVLSAREKATHILRKAEERAHKLVLEAQEKAELDAMKILKRGREELEVEHHRVREELLGEVASLSVLTSGLILKKEVDEKVHQGLILQTLQGAR